MVTRFSRSPPCAARKNAPEAPVSCPRGGFAAACRRRAMTLCNRGLLTRAATRTREFTARSCPSRRPVRIRTPAGRRASGIRATGAAIQRRPIKSWAQARNSAGASHTPVTPSPRPQFLAAPGATRTQGAQAKGSPSSHLQADRQTNRPPWSAASPWARPCWTSSGTAA